MFAKLWGWLWNVFAGASPERVLQFDTRHARFAISVPNDYELSRDDVARIEEQVLSWARTTDGPHCLVLPSGWKLQVFEAKWSDRE